MSKEDGVLDEALEDGLPEGEGAETQTPEEIEAAAAVAAEGEGEGEGEEEEEAPAAHMIPKSRYDSAQKRARTAEARVKQYEEQASAATAAATADADTASTLDSELEELDRGIAQAQLDGDTDKVVLLSKQARAVEKGIYQTMTETAAASAGTKAQESVKLDSLIDILEDQYDILNPDSDNFDEDKINEILDMQKAFVKNGETPSAAMLKSVGYIMPEQRITDEVAGKRRTNVAKNLKAAEAQAPGTTDTGVNSDTTGKKEEGLNLEQMTQDEFDALPPETLKRLRGDAV
jgi:hypothetical protein